MHDSHKTVVVVVCMYVCMLQNISTV